MVEIRALNHNELSDWLDALAQLRMAVFKDWPYLYDGDMDYERQYLRAYTDSAGAFIAGAFDGRDMVGACTASPLTDHHDAFRAPLALAGLDPAQLFYLGESVLLPAYRGTGIGHRFFDLREAEAQRQGFSQCVFCAVQRAIDDPRRPQGYAPLDMFWMKRGYECLTGAKAHFGWKDIGDDHETRKPMVFWHRHLVQ